MKYKKYIFIYFNLFDLCFMLILIKCNMSVKDNKLIFLFC